MATFKAAVLRESGPAEVLRLEDLPLPKPKLGQVLIRIKAFGLNRSELFTRQGHSPSVKLPRVLGIECVGVVEEAPGAEFSKGQKVATAMGGLGRQLDGGYAEYTVAPARQVSFTDPAGFPLSDFSVNFFWAGFSMSDFLVVFY